MSEDRERVFRMALSAVLRAAVDQGLAVDTLSEAAIELMLNDIAYTQDDVAEAVIAIEVAADAVAVR
ncbi:hypothetical protein [Pseudomonas sp. NPDC088444]|uniref:hypothetical protein n=1 Tax=Pseudomonas sp. NPDC088444 TaxID=3364456 RepID=UPI00384C4E7A